MPTSITSTCYILLALVRAGYNNTKHPEMDAVGRALLNGRSVPFSCRLATPLDHTCAVELAVILASGYGHCQLNQGG